MVAIGLLGLVLSIVGTHTVANGEDTQIPTIIRLQSPEPLIRQAAFDTLVSNRKDDIAQVLAILEKEDIDQAFNGPLHRSIKLLGAWRASEAVVALTNRFMYVPTDFDIEEMLPSEAYHVSAVALVQIGEPSIGVMVERIRMTKSTSERHLAAWVIMEIEGKEQAMCRLARMSQQDKIATERYAEAEEFIKTYVPKFEHPK